MRKTILAIAAFTVFSSTVFAQQPQILRAPDGSPATLAPAAPVAVPAASSPTYVVAPTPTMLPAVSAPAMPTANAAPTMMVRTVGELNTLCAKQDTADEINSCLNLLSTALANVRTTEAQRGSRYVCNSERLMNVKLRQLFLNWAQTNPSFAGDDANRGVLTALMQVYPCPTGNVIGAAVPAPRTVVAPADNAPANYMTGY